MKTLDYIVNFCMGIVSIFQGNFPFAIAFFATALSWFDETGKYIGDSFGALIQGTANALIYFNGTLKPFVLDIIGSLATFTSVWYPKINAIFPLDFLLSGVSIYLTARLIGLVIRIVKSFVPTISG